MIKILNLNTACLNRITYEMESEMWYDSLWTGDAEDLVNIELNENVILKAWSEEIMIDFAGEKVFFYKDDFERIQIV